MTKNIIQKINQSKKPILILICGMPGSKKSSTAIKLAAKLNKFSKRVISNKNPNL